MSGYTMIQGFVDSVRIPGALFITFGRPIETLRFPLLCPAPGSESHPGRER
jgi:hypothetical protein